MQISMKGKVTTCVNKLIEAAHTCESFNKLEKEQNPNLSQVQALMVLDTGESAHIAGFGTLFDNFLENKELGNFTGKGSVPVESKDPNNRKSLLVIERYEEKRRKRKIGELNMFMLFY